MPRGEAGCTERSQQRVGLRPRAVGCSICAAMLLAAAAVSADEVHGAIIGVPHGGIGDQPPQMDIYIAAGRGEAFEWDELVPSSVSVAFHHAKVLRVDSAPAGSTTMIPWEWLPGKFRGNGPDTSNSFKIIDLPATPLPSGFLCTVTLAENTVLSEAGIEYERLGATWLKIGDTTLQWPGNGPAFVVLDGKGDEKGVQVFGGMSSMRSIQLAFNGPTSGEDAIVEAGAGVTTSSGATISVFSGGEKIGWGSFAGSFSIPTASPIGNLKFPNGFSLDAINLRSEDTLAESKLYRRLRVFVINGRDSFLHRPKPKAEPAMLHDEL